MTLPRLLTPSWRPGGRAGRPAAPELTGPELTAPELTAGQLTGRQVAARQVAARQVAARQVARWPTAARPGRGQEKEGPGQPGQCPPRRPRTARRAASIRPIKRAALRLVIAARDLSDVPGAGGAGDARRARLTC
jgi:hypothetical protein